MGRTIVVIDDDAFITDLYRRALENAGFRVIVAADADQAMKLLVHEKPDLVLLDIIMPGQDGFEVLKAMQASEDLKQIPVFVFSNLPQDGNEERARSLGAVEYMIKANTPPRTLLAKLNKTLSQQ